MNECMEKTNKTNKDATSFWLHAPIHNKTNPFSRQNTHGNRTIAIWLFDDCYYSVSHWVFHLNPGVRECIIPRRCTILNMVWIVCDRLLCAATNSMKNWFNTNRHQCARQNMYHGDFRLIRILLLLLLLFFLRLAFCVCFFLRSHEC